MDTLSNLAFGLQVALSYDNLFYCFMGVFIGTIVGVLPGIGSLAGVSMLLPITYYLPPTGGVIMLAGIYYGVQYGGSVASIVLNLPGAPSTAITCLDGYPMARQGRAGVALLMTTAASFIGGSFGIVALAAFGPAIAAFGLSFGPAEYFSIMVLGLVAAGMVTQGSPLKGAAMVLLGLLLGTVGTDISTGVQRFTFGLGGLYEGIPLVALAMGLFGLSEVIERVNDTQPQPTQRMKLRSMVPTADDVKRSVAPVARGTVIGSFFGALPGAGVSLSSFLAYAAEKRVSRTPERFGKGAIEGITAPEAANNAAAQTSFIPTLTLGVPGDATMALLLGALMIHGLAPGPSLIANHPDLFWGLIGSFWIGNVLLVILNVPMVGLWVRLLQLPYGILYPSIIVFVSMGVYTISNNPFDLMVVVFFGALGYLMRIFAFEPAPLLIALVLGPMIEENFRRALVISRGDPSIFVSRPMSGALLLATVVVIAWIAHRSAQARRRSRAAAQAGG